ncbi:MAG: Gfo/Idh/MocA family oxidoreductase [Candidatus Woesearchaeota archaeon]|jgi:predicted dehydrogenase|nr:Gfo/Idh/MocA family oxidoreductase [Candidatus Woesearchaeota archaeon]MDP7181051.1 Gfo/Idh/MocA family oxidoreductase [Candidatus Woesearchaeota archaeon]MDP7198328.1 Gfo/Idh/MocA family oxidoreductase [Candidatus Woesearchaeota archaeon]MDP7467430.1 Gfo/Idh/MocA family oxidoreductase [Candidatus Woesearchaeota archaeon]MDP7647657.1 Gfo/Idh/MocA family oxidoreductase [Candidatus Woesearchaeota archaeon]
MKPVDAVLIGAGVRGMNTFGKFALTRPESLNYVAVVEPDKEKRDMFGEHHDIPESKRFVNCDKLFSKKPMADAVVIATPDRCHYENTLCALDAGYKNVLLEKPIATSVSHCIEIVERAKQANARLMIMHEMRYTPLFASIKLLIDSGAVGDVKKINQTEQVGNWHFPHSYVRGNWGNKATSGPVALTKCCHDFDIFHWLVGKPCKTVKSWSKELYFREANAPGQVPSKCTDGCSHSKTCPYFAPRIYTQAKASPKLKAHVHPSQDHEMILKVLPESPYGLCVYKCDNDVPDYQETDLEFEDGLKVHFVMEQENPNCTRKIEVVGTKGRITGSLDAGELFVYGDGKKRRVELSGDPAEHWGGDPRLIQDFVSAIRGETTKVRTSAEEALHSHLIAFAAEEARLTEKKVDMEAFIEHERRLHVPLKTA